MWIRDVDVPRNLIEAARDGSLVIFIGAGASRDEPSGLPDFKSLIREVGRQLHIAPSERDENHPDSYLGRLEDQGMDVRALVRDSIGRPNSEPNRLHHAVVRLAAAGPHPRIVTTNYDLHLSEAAENLAVHLETYLAPALPLGDDFHGVVHLHGSLEQEPRRLVLTDSDFGAAYLRDAWAARFLERMFSAFTVLFIGYSHGDVVMQYLARSLGRSRQDGAKPVDRYVLTHEPEKDDWRSLGLTSVAYIAENGSHEALPEVLERWAEQATMGLMDHQRRVTEIVTSGPQLSPEENSYLEETLRDPERVKYFTRASRGRQWQGVGLDWAADLPQFKGMFVQQVGDPDSSATLASWVAEHYMPDPECSTHALKLLREQPWSPSTWWAIARRFLAREGTFEPFLEPWLALMIQNAPLDQSDFLEMLLSGCDWGDRLEPALLLWDYLTEPVLAGAPYFSIGEEEVARFDIILRGKDHWLNKAWAKVFVPALSKQAKALIAIADHHLGQAYRLQGSTGQPTTFDAISFARSAIETHEQDELRNVVFVLIDSARDCLESLLEHEPAIAQGYLESWAAGSAAALRRLAVHGWCVRGDVDATQKLSWLRQRGWLYDFDVQHEVFRLLELTLPSADAEQVAGILEESTAGPEPSPEPAPEHPDPSLYRRYNLLAWMARVTPEVELIQNTFGALQADHPEWEPREHPDLGWHMTSGRFVESPRPFTPDELRGWIQNDPADAVRKILGYEDAERGRIESPWEQAMAVVAEVSAATPDAALSLIPEVHDSRIQRALLRGWGRALFSQEGIHELLYAVDSWDLAVLRSGLIPAFADGGREGNPTVWHADEQARLLATRLWPTEPTEGNTSSDDKVKEAINQPAGRLAEFWLKAISHDWEQSAENWMGIAAASKAELDRMARQQDHNGLLARTVLAGNLHFLFAADPEWTKGQLLPLMSETDRPDEVSALWQGFLSWGRPNDALLAAGLLQAYQHTYRGNPDLDGRLLGQLAQHLAWIAMFADLQPEVWLADFTASASNEVRVAWAKSIGRSLRDMDRAAQDVQWNRWIHDYWKQRNIGVPRPLDIEEASAMTDWSLGLVDHLDEVATLATAKPARLERSDHLIHKLESSDLGANPEAWCHLLAHVLSHTQKPFYGAHALQAIASKLREAQPEIDLTKVIEQALRLGITDASTW